MPKIKKKGTSGAAKNYLTRSQAVRKLQISLADFRRLCIFKGIYPREPRSKKRANKSSTPSTTFYYAKDIQYLLHEPLLARFRDQKALAKKISKALGRNEVNEAGRLEKNLTPRMKLDHVIKERYPTFVDALRDLDDALSMLNLFANLPASDHVPAKVIAKCQRLTMEFEHYLIRSNAVRKSFLSIKGIYYQATIQGQDILWLVPYKFVQRTGGDVDFRIMATFVEFYMTLLGFVNFRLYTGVGLVYPPRFDAKSEEQGAGLSAFQLDGPKTAENGQGSRAIADAETQAKAQAEADKLVAATEEEELPTDGQTTTEDETVTATAVLDQFTSVDPAADSLHQPSLSADSNVARTLFSNTTVYLSRETPRHPLEFLLRAFGCKRVAWDSLIDEPGSYCREDDPRITHQIVDRPDIPLPSAAEEAEMDADDREALEAARKKAERVPGRIYVQPQWVWDSLNAGKLQRPDLYAPGATLPPHLSPFVRAKKGEYDPSVPLAEQETEAEAEVAALEDEDEDDEDEEDADSASEGEEAPGVRGDAEARDLEDEMEEDGGMDVRLADSESESEDADADGATGDFGGFSGSEDGDEDEDPNSEDAKARAYQAELEAEARGETVADKKQSAAEKKAAIVARKSRAQREEDEDVERRKMMMSRRKRKMYEKMVYSNARKDEEAEKLRGKRRRIEKKAAGN